MMRMIKEPNSIPVAASSELQIDAPSNRLALNLWSLSVLAFAAVILALPMLLHGPMLQGHDTYEHLNYSHHFSEQFWAGELYPRWLTGMNHGLGSPTLFVYPPLPSYVYTILEPVGRICHFDAFTMGEFLTLFGSGICSLLWLSSMATRRVALAGAVLYMLMPYHLAIDFYRRTALSECWALVWIPLILYFSTRLIKPKPHFSVGLAVAYAMLILSHLVSVFIVSLIPLAAAVAFSPRGHKLKSVLYTAAGMLLGIGLSCFYFLSALANAKYFPVSRLPLWSYVEGHLLTVGKLLDKSPDGFIRLMSLTVVDMLAVCIVCSAFVLAKGQSKSKKEVLFWLMICLIPVLLMHGRSAPIWHMCPPLFAAIQYPWRLNIVLCIATLPIVAMFLSEISSVRPLFQALLFALLCVLLTPWLFSYTNIWARYRVETPRQMTSVSDDDGWFPAWSAPGIDDASALRASSDAQLTFLGGTGSASVLLWKPRHIEFLTNSSTGGQVMINQFYYPAWRASDNNQAIPVRAKAAEGLLEVNVPPGIQRVRLEIPISLTERIGRWISGFCLLLSVALAWVLRPPASHRNVRAIGQMVSATEG
jgi:hypothetical protein